MKYFRAKKDGVYDNKTWHCTIKNELVTLSERKRMFPTLSDACFDEVSISKCNTHTFFGVRFENH